MDAQTFIDAGGGGKPRPTSSVFFKTSAAAVISLPIPRSLSLVFGISPSTFLVSRSSESFAAQTTPVGISAQMIAFFVANNPWFGNANLENGVFIYICCSTGQQGMLVFAENVL